MGECCKAWRRPCRPEMGPFEGIAGWAERRRRFWDWNFERLDDYPQELDRKEKEHGSEE